MSAGAGEILLHPRLCHRNFWMNSCRGQCKSLHLRRPGRKLVIFNAAANLNRIDRKLGPDTLTNMKMPFDSELYIVDSQIDPEDFGNSITFKDPRIFVARAIGLHPGNSAPKEYFQLFKNGLTSIDTHFGLAYTGPFGGNSNIKPEERCDAKSMATHFTSKASTASQKKFSERPTALGHKDEALLAHMTPCQEASQCAQVFMSANKNTAQQLTAIMDLLRVHPYMFATFNSDSNEYSRLKILDVMDRSSGRKILLESASPSMRNATPSDLMPLSIVNFIVELYLNFQKDRHFKSLGYSLAEFNTFFTENGFNMVPKHLFQLYKTTEALTLFDLAVKQTLGLAYRTHREQMSYGRSAQQTAPKSTQPPAENSKPTNLMSMDLAEFANTEAQEDATKTLHQLINNPNLMNLVNKLVALPKPHEVTTGAATNECASSPQVLKEIGNVNKDLNSSVSGTTTVPVSPSSDPGRLVLDDNAKQSNSQNDWIRPLQPVLPSTSKVSNTAKTAKNVYSICDSWLDSCLPNDENKETTAAKKRRTSSPIKRPSKKKAKTSSQVEKQLAKSEDVIDLSSSDDSETNNSGNDLEKWLDGGPY